MVESIGPYTDYMKDLSEQVHDLIAIATAARRDGRCDFTDSQEMSLSKGLESRIRILLPRLGEKVTYTGSNLQQEYENREITILKAVQDILRDKELLLSDQERARLALHYAFAMMTNATIFPVEIIPKITITRDKRLKVVFSNLLRMVYDDFLPVFICAAELVISSFSLKRANYSQDLVKRLEEEIQIYDPDRWKEKRDLSYLRFISFVIDGEPLSSEVKRYRDVKGVDSNRVRGGLAEFFLDFPDKASEIYQLARKIGLNSLYWVKKRIIDTTTIEPVRKVYPLQFKLGKPFLSTEAPAFRLRYGRTASTGFNSVGVHPATMYLLECLTPGTTMQTDMLDSELAVFPVTGISGPLISLKNCSMKRLTTLEEAIEDKGNVSEIHHLGDMIIDITDITNEGIIFSPGYTSGSWSADLKFAMISLKRSSPSKQDLTEYNKYVIPELGQSLIIPDPDTVFSISEDLGIPFHPDWTPRFTKLTVDELKKLLAWINEATLNENGLKGSLDEVIPMILKKSFIPFSKIEGMILLLRDRAPASMLKKISSGNWNEVLTGKDSDKITIDVVNSLSEISFSESKDVKSSFKLGIVRKTTSKRMNPAVHGLFPGLKNSILINNKKITATETKLTLACLKCPNCNKETFFSYCLECKVPTVPVYRCRNNHGPYPRTVTSCPECGHVVTGTRIFNENIREELKNITSILGKTPKTFKVIPDLKTVSKIPENLMKGFIRSLHGLYVYKDGTVRISAPVMPLTHWKSSDESSDSLLEDEYGELTTEFFPHDVVISRSVAKLLIKIAAFVDELLETFYGKSRFYNIKTPEQLIGHYLGCIASNSLVSLPLKIVGVTDYEVVFIHPFYFAFAGKKAADPVDFFLLLDGLLNFSLYLLPSKRGGTNGVPFFLEIPSRYDTINKVKLSQGPYPAVFFDYLNSQAFDEKNWAIAREQEYEFMDYLELGKDIPYYMNNPNGNTFFAKFPSRNEYQKLSLEKKIEKQLELAVKLDTVDDDLIIDEVMNSAFRSTQKLFKRFLNQEFECVDCKTCYPIPSFTGTCWFCSGKIKLTVNPDLLEKKYLWFEEAKKKYPLKQRHINEITRIKLDFKAILKMKHKSLTEVFPANE